MLFFVHCLLICALSIQLYSTSTAIKVIGQHATVTVGGDAILFCQLVDTNERLTRITWQKRTRDNPKNENIFFITPDGKTETVNGLGDRIEFIGNIKEFIGSVHLKNVTSTDVGIYTCIFNIFPSGPFEKEIQLTVQVPPVVSVNTDVPPVVGQSPVTLATCTAAKAWPEARISWHLGALSDSVTVETNVYTEPDGSYTVKSHLIGVASKELNQQKVQCLVNHTSLNKELILDYELVIHYPPQIVYIISLNVPTTSQEFQCIADANPQPTTFIWSRANKALSGKVDDERLVISLSSDNNGLYMCNASNQYGNGTGTIYMQISTECTTVCWSLLISLFFVIAAGWLIRRLHLTGKFKCISEPRERTGYDSEPVPTGDKRENHGESSGNISL